MAFHLNYFGDVYGDTLVTPESSGFTPSPTVGQKAPYFSPDLGIVGSVYTFFVVWNSATTF